jgi:dolichol-phosphate mannosyltransferase
VISLVIPTLNEAENIEPLVARLVQCQPRLEEIIFVDDGSTDGTRERIRSLSGNPSVRLIERETPALGLSGAVIAGARAAAGDWLVVMDADLSHPPEKIAELLRPLLEDRADIVIGSRYVQGGSTPGWPLWRKILSRSAAGLAYPLTGVHDSMCGFFALPRKLLLELTPAATGFKIAFEALVQGGKNLRVLEIPIAFRDRTRGVSKMSFGVAVLFAFRWIAAMTKTLSRGQKAASRLSRQSSNASPAKSSKVANNALP